MSRAPSHLRGAHFGRFRRGIFSDAVVLLVARTEYSQSLSFYWSPAWNILSRCLSIGHPQGIFSSHEAPTQRLCWRTKLSRDY
eukprot:3503884-Pyramimonas_sp.AAC.1